MKILIITILSGCAIHLASSKKEGLTLGRKCEINRDCKSQQCTPICDSTNKEKVCMMPKWYFFKKRKVVPSCVPSNAEDSRRVVEATKKEEQLPTVSFNSKRSKIVENHFSALKNLGQSCSQHSDCYSKNCISICESPRPEEESRCIEPEMSFSMHNLPTPKCVSREAMENLVSGMDSSIEQVIWTRLGFLRAKASENTDKQQGGDRLGNIRKLDASAMNKEENGYQSWGNFYSTRRNDNI